MALSILCVACVACGRPDAGARAADPNAPAVVKAPPPILASDTAKKEVPPLIDAHELHVQLVQLYALAGAGLTFADPKLIVSAYAPTAQLITPNGTFTGTQSIVNEYHSFGMDGSVKDFQRVPLKTSIVDSTVIDSGVYSVVRKRANAASVTEKGAYASEWRIHPAPLTWVMTKDHLYQTKRASK
jgi:hypothetical protein